MVLLDEWREVCSVWSLVSLAFQSDSSSLKRRCLKATGPSHRFDTNLLSPVYPHPIIRVDSLADCQTFLPIWAVAVRFRWCCYGVGADERRRPLSVVLPSQLTPQLTPQYYSTRGIFRRSIPQRDAEAKKSIATSTRGPVRCQRQHGQSSTSEWKEAGAGNPTALTEPIALCNAP